MDLHGTRDLGQYNLLMDDSPFQLGALHGSSLLAASCNETDPQDIVEALS